MAVYSFEWKSGPSDNPLVMNFADDIVIQEGASQTFEKGYPLAIDLSVGSTAGVIELKAADADDNPIFIAATDALNASAVVDLTQPGVNAASLPYILRPGDILSVTVSASSGSNVATNSDFIGTSYGWRASAESGETTKAVLDTDDTTNAYFTVIGFDDRDAVGTSGGRMLVMYNPVGTLTAPTVA